MKYNRKTGTPVWLDKRPFEPRDRIWLWLLAAAVLLGGHNAHAQIVNGNFETHSCPFTGNKEWGAFQNTDHDVNGTTDPHCVAGSWLVSHGTPDIYKQGHGGNTTIYAQIRCNGLGPVEHNGSEGLFVECPTFLAGRTYRLRVRFFTDTPSFDSIDNVFMYLATGLVHRNNVNFTVPTPTSSQLIHNIPNFFCSGGTWKSLDFTFIPDTNYTQLWFYGLNAEAEDGRNLFMDDVSVVETCPDHTTYTAFNGTPALTERSNFIDAYGISHVDPGQQVVFRAGNYVHLGNGFHARPRGGFFHAFIAPCIWEQPIQSCRDNGGGISDVSGDPTLKMGSRWSGGDDGSGDREGASVAMSQEQLLMNYPNPFTGKTTIEYHVPEEGSVELVVLNMLGQKVAELVGGVHRLAGQYRAEFDGSGLSPGAYYYRLRVGQYTAIQKMILTR